MFTTSLFIYLNSFVVLQKCSYLMEFLMVLSYVSSHYLQLFYFQDKKYVYFFLCCFFIWLKLLSILA